MATYTELFAVPQFRILFGVRLVTMLGVVVSSLTLGTVVYAQTASPLASALATFGGPALRLATAHSLLAAADLLPARTAIVLTSTVAGLTDLAQLVPGLPWWGRFVLLAIGELVIGATSGTVVALLADLVPAGSFALGRATLNLTVGGMQVLGYALGAVALAALDPVHLFALSGVASLLAAALARWGLAHRGPRATGRVLSRTREINRRLLGSRTLRPVFVAAWVPNGLVVGCEALFIPYAGPHAGWLFAAGAAGMLAGDLAFGRFVSEAGRDRSLAPLRALLAAPYVGFALLPTLAPACILVGLSAVGYAGSLALQDRLARHVSDDARGQAFGLFSTGQMVGQGLGAALGGALATVLGAGPGGAAHAMVLLAGASLLLSAALTPGLRRSQVPSFDGCPTEEGRPNVRGMTTLTETAPLSRLLRESTAQVHREAETSTFMADLLGGSSGREAFVALTGQLWFVYSALEEAVDAAAGDPVLTPLLDERLRRVPALEADLDVLDPGWRDRLRPTPATSAYVDALRRADPARLVAHHYTRYLGDLSGGQVIPVLLQRHYGIDEGVSFYRFDGIDKVKPYKDAYRAALDALPLDAAGREAVADAAVEAFELNTEMFASLT